jgi:hypothetical protein
MAALPPDGRPAAPDPPARAADDVSARAAELSSTANEVSFYVMICGRPPQPDTGASPPPSPAQLADCDAGDTLAPG